jgi:hypothetical protein
MLDVEGAASDLGEQAISILVTGLARRALVGREQIGVRHRPHLLVVRAVPFDHPNSLCEMP